MHFQNIISLLILFTAIYVNILLYVESAPLNFQELLTRDYRSKEENTDLIVPKYMTDLYNIIADKRGRGRKGVVQVADKIRCFLSGPSSSVPEKEVSFDVRDIHINEMILKAELDIYKSRPRFGRDQRGIFQVEIIDTSNGRTEAVRILSTHSGGWKSFDLTETVKKWHRRRWNTNRLFVRITGRVDNSSVVLGGENNGRLPFLVVYSKSNGAVHMKPSENTLPDLASIRMPQRTRSSRNKRGSVGHPCKRKSMLVDTTKIGWDRYVLAPRIFDAYRCEGKCRAYSSQAVNKQTNHAVIQAILSQLGTKYNGRPIKPPCCAPASFEHIKLLLHRNSNGQSVIGLEEFNDMIVKSCACL